MGFSTLGDVHWPTIPRRRCWPKVQHDTKVQADIHMKSLLASARVEGFAHLNSYECPFPECGKWHVGRDKTRLHRKYTKAPDDPGCAE